jgi:tetratricopeptide (TPR) repeat protein
MSILKRLFGGAQPSGAMPAAAAAPGQSASVTTYGDHFAHVDELGLMGPYVRSPDGRLILICGTFGGGGGPRSGGYAVLDGRQLLVSGRADRPQEGRIADNGIFIFNDWLDSAALSGRFMAFRANGEKVIDQLFNANLIGNGLSEDGRYAVCQTANAPGSPDSCIVASFDLEHGILLAKWQPECGTARGFEFDPSGGWVDLLTHDGDRETYNLATAELRDREGWLAGRLARGDLRVIGDLVKEAAELKDDELSRIRAGLAAAQSSSDGRTCARAFRLEGELLEALGRYEGAMSAYEQALRIDPQVGVAKRLAKLRRAEAGPVRPRPRSRFQEQAARLGIGHDQILLEQGQAKMWRHQPSDAFTPVELAALAHYQRDGWSGCASEGELMLTLIKAASFPTLDPQHADVFVESLYYHDVPGRLDHETLIANVEATDMDRIARNWRIISATAGQSPAYYPRVAWEHVGGLFSALGASRLAQVARIFATAPYDLRAGWPDLTLWRGKELRFVEVKSPSDGMHASQARLISAVLVPLGFDTVLAEVKAAASGDR